MMKWGNILPLAVLAIATSLISFNKLNKVDQKDNLEQHELFHELTNAIYHLDTDKLILVKKTKNNLSINFHDGKMFAYAPSKNTKIYDRGTGTDFTKKILEGLDAGLTLILYLDRETGKLIAYKV
ncbi:hypothetical protein ACJD0Z_16830 [Flavobacteriaceae bacterium M23B6Z8]